jgi:hypothetical protein
LYNSNLESCGREEEEEEEVGGAFEECSKLKYPKGKAFFSEVFGCRNPSPLKIY